MNKNMLLFGSKDCGPCKMMKAMLDSHGVKYNYCDVGVDPAKATKYGVGALPTMFILNGSGGILDSRVGRVDIHTVKRLLSAR